ncbi:unnamed protein product [Arabidopsis arenosa]|uniref:Uncharacterized protein n=1 Tax=Arabidopsis arenosa TaxID=38785 RepID=A0A8S2ADK7_ARAAE|nr:unnamed protein product [Arabidopsis arenosa]
MVWCGGVGDKLLGLMEFLITNRSVGLSTAMGYAAMDVASLLMHESQQVSLFRRVSYGYLVLVIVMGLSGSEGHENLEMMMSLLTNSWLGLFQLLVSTTVADVITFFVVRVFSPPSRGVLVRVMIMWFIHGVFSGYARHFRYGDNNCRQRFSENLQSSMHMGSRNYIEGICREDLQRRLWCGMYNRMGLHRYQAKLFASCNGTDMD